MSTVVPWERSRGMIPQATAPLNPSAGQEYVRDSDHHLMRHDGSSWVDTDAGGGGGSTPPTSTSVAFTNGIATVAHSGATTSQHVVVSRDGADDEADLEPLILSAWVSASNTVSVRAHTLRGNAFTGSAVINYTIG